MRSPLIAGVVLTTLLQPAAVAQAPAAATTAASSPGIVAARTWLALLDRQQWVQSWSAAGTIFTAQLPAWQWQAMVQPLRAGLGPVLSRVAQSDTRTTTLPGLPVGDYEIVQFRTRFANQPDAIETVSLAREPAGWKVDGYFVR